MNVRTCNHCGVPLEGHEEEVCGRELAGKRLLVARLIFGRDRLEVIRGVPSCSQRVARLVTSALEIALHEKIALHERDSPLAGDILHARRALRAGDSVWCCFIGDRLTGFVCGTDSALAWVLG